MILVFLGVLLPAAIVYVFGADIVARAVAAADARHPLVLLVFVAFLVACVSGVLIQRTVTSLARTVEVEARQELLDEAPAARDEEHRPLMNSAPLILTPMERRTAELHGSPERLDCANSELESENAWLRAGPFTDEPTRLYNRRFFSIRVEEEVARHRRFGHPLSLVLLGLDGFKAVNDGPGRQAADQTLRQVADILLKNSRGVDVVFRYADNEFAVLLVETSGAGARSYAEHIRDVLCTSSFGPGRLITASFGVACFPEDVATAGALVRAADEALDSAKRAGKNCLVVFRELGSFHVVERDAQA
jgi:diguanylate cyclase (GGDEF)-like protein